jgi:predicted CoA-substrate-specific enzyme activase
MKGIYLGVDVGSVSTNIIAMNEDCQLIFRYYSRTSGQPTEAVIKGLKDLKKELSNIRYSILGVGATGSGRQLAGTILGADVVKNEITAHATATTSYYPEVRTILEIGGQDSKIILVKDGMVTDFAMNTVCAAGTGSFLDHQSERMGIPIQEFGDLALMSKKNVRIAGRCTVFAESDMIAKQQYGFSKADIIKGLCEALVRNYINNLGRGKVLEPPFVFQGGVAANKGIRVAFEKELGHEILIPENFDVMGAIGIAFLAKENHEINGGESSFNGLETLNLDFEPTTFECTGCSNHCEVIKVEAEGRTIAMWGDKCGKWSNSLIA